jgi:cystathionine beta-lyase/cystathionine gamma-synthase
MGAVDTIIKLLSQGDEVIATDDLYGGTYRLFTKVFEKMGIRFHFVDMHDFAAVEACVNDKTRMIWIETPTNPMMKIIDIAHYTAMAKRLGVWSVVDNTFASPYLQNPLDMGADIVMHSATKYLGGSQRRSDGRAHDQQQRALRSTGIHYQFMRPCSRPTRLVLGVARIENAAFAHEGALRKRKSGC